MAALFFNDRRMDLPESVGSIGEWKGIIANELQRAGFTDVVNTQSEVAGNRNPGGVRASVVHLFIGGRSFFEMVMAAGDTVDAAQRSINDVVTRIRNIHTL